MSVHRVELRRLGRLRQGQTAQRLDGLRAQRAVGAHSRQHHTDGPLALVARQRRKQQIDRQTLAAGLNRRRQVQHAGRHGQVTVGGEIT